MFWNLVQAENTKVLKRAILWVELGLLGLLIVFVDLALYAALQMPSSATQMTEQAREVLKQTLVWPGGLSNALSMAAGNGLGGLIVIVLVGTVTAQEYGWRTIHLWLSNGVPRPSLLGAKFAVFALPALLIVFVPLLVGGIVTAFMGLQMVGSLNLDEVDFARLALTALSTAYTLLPYAALTFTLAVVTRSVAAAIGIGVAYALLLESVFISVGGLIGGFPAKLVQFTPSGLSSSLLKGVSQGPSLEGDLGTGGLTVEYADPVVAAVLIGAYALILFATALWAFRRQDLSA